MRLLAVWLINAIALLALPYLVPSIRIDGFATALGAAPVSYTHLDVYKRQQKT